MVIVMLSDKQKAGQGEWFYPVILSGIFYFCPPMRITKRSYLKIPVQRWDKGLEYANFYSAFISMLSAYLLFAERLPFQIRSRTPQPFQRSIFEIGKPYFAEYDLQYVEHDTQTEQFRGMPTPEDSAKAPKRKQDGTNDSLHLIIRKPHTSVRCQQIQEFPDAFHMIKDNESHRNCCRIKRKER